MLFHFHCPFQQYGDPSSCYSITPLGAPSEGTSSAADSSQLYTSTSLLDHHHQQHHQQYSSALNLFASGAYPATPAALMHSAMGPLLGGGGALGALSGNEESEQLKRDKDLIYSHPLFPLLTVLFQKCELATCTPREPFREGDQVDTSHVCSATSFDEDLADFAKTVQMNKPYYVPNAELDSLMLNAIQVLRYHLLELEKVHELCDNFCTKYVNKIKERTQMDINAGEQAPPPPQPQTLDQLPQHRQMHHQMAPQTANNGTPTMEQHQQMRGQHFAGTQFAGGAEQMGAHIESLHQQPCSSTPMQMGFLDLSSSATPSSVVHSNASAVGTPAGIEFDQAAHFYVQQQQQQHQFGRTATMGGGGAVGEHFEGKRKSHKKAKIYEQQLQHNDPSASEQPSPDTTARAESQSAGCGGTGSRSSTTTAMGSSEEQQHQLLISGETANQMQQQQQQLNNANGGMVEENGDDIFSNCGDSMGEERDSAGSETEQKPYLGGQKRSAEDNGGDGHRKKVPKVFSKEAISKFRAWLFNNITHPYPTEEQKKQLATETGLTILQVNNWFINARRRIVQPMIDSNNRAGRSVQVFKNRRRKNSGGIGTPPSPAPEGHSPELLLNGNGGASRNGGIFGASPEDPLTAVSASNGGSSSVSNCSASSLRSLHASVPPGSSAQQSSPLLASAAAGIVVPLSSPATASVMPSYQANAAAAAAVAAAAVTNPYANFGGATAGFPFVRMGGVSSMIAPYALNPMAGAGGWAGIDLNATHQGNLDG